MIDKPIQVYPDLPIHHSLGIAESEYLRTKEIYEKLQKDYDSGKSVGQALSTARVPYMNAKEEYEKQKEIYDNLEKETNDYASKINYIAEQIKADDLYPQPEEGTLTDISWAFPPLRISIYSSFICFKATSAICTCCCQ